MNSLCFLLSTQAGPQSHTWETPRQEHCTERTTAVDLGWESQQSKHTHTYILTISLWVVVKLGKKGVIFSWPSAVLNGDHLEVTHFHLFSQAVMNACWRWSKRYLSLCQTFSGEIQAWKTHYNQSREHVDRHFKTRQEWGRVDHFNIPTRHFWVVKYFFRPIGLNEYKEAK